MNKLSLPRRRIYPGDHLRLQALARSLAEQSHPLAETLAEELDRAELCNPDDIHEATVSLDSFVTYRIVGSEHFERRLLIHPEDQMWPPAEISVATPLGITLLGLSAGDRTLMMGACLQEPPRIEVVAVGPAATGGLARQPAFPREAPSLSLAGHRA